MTIKLDRFVPPFLKSFNCKKIDYTGYIVGKKIPVTPEVKKMLKFVALEGENPFETMTRILENYLLLIHLVKAFKLVIHDAVTKGTVIRLEELLPKVLAIVGGPTPNKDLLLDLNDKLDEEIHQFMYGEVLRKEVEISKPILEFDKLKPVLEIHYGEVLQFLVSRGLSQKNFDLLEKTNTNIGYFCLQTFLGTMSLLDHRLQKKIANERARYPLRNLELEEEDVSKFYSELFSRLKEVNAYSED